MQKVLASTIMALMTLANWPAWAANIANPLVFKVTPQGKTSPVSYLFGTVHFGPSISDLPPQVLSVFDKAEVRAFEISWSDQYLAIKAFAADPTDANLLNLIPDLPSYPMTGAPDNIIAKLVGLGIPNALARVLSPDDCATFEQFRYFSTHKNLHSLDGELELRALANGQAIFELEDQNVRDQADQAAADQGAASTCKIADYLDNPQKVAELDASTNQEMTGYLNLKPEDILRSDYASPETAFRNQVWIAKLNPMMAGKSVFVTVGYDHLKGANGLIQLLKGLGYTVEPMQ